MNPSLPKQTKTSLGPERGVLIAYENNEIEERQKSIQEDRGIADDENEDQAIRERARAIERITEIRSGLMHLRMREKNLKKALY